MTDRTRNVLLLIPAGKEPEQAIRTAIQLAKERQGTLIALVVIEPEVAQRVSSTLSDIGFVGEHVGNQVQQALLREYRALSEKLLQALAERARSEGVPVTPLIESGDAGEICGRVIRAQQVGTAVLVAEKRSWLTRFLSRGAAVRLPALAGCEVRVMEED